MNLLVGDYLKHQPGTIDAMKQASVLINWWKWHLVPFSWLQAEMKCPLALLTGCLTRWGSQVAAIIRLLESAMMIVLFRSKQDILDTIDGKVARDTAAQILKDAQSDFMWAGLEHMVQNLLPLRVTVRVLESDSARLDQVIWQFGKLAALYKGIDHMLVSLEKRWAKMDQKLFLVAYALHPARQRKHLNDKVEFAHQLNIATYATDLYERFFEASKEDVSQLFLQLADYFSKSGSFSMSLPRFTDPDKQSPTFWKFMCQSAPQLSKLALHLFQIAVNSAAVERLFSAFGNI